VFEGVLVGLFCLIKFYISDIDKETQIENDRREYQRKLKKKLH
jgi:hypothetical protein